MQAPVAREAGDDVEAVTAQQPRTLEAPGGTAQRHPRAVVARPDHGDVAALADGNVRLGAKQRLRAADHPRGGEAPVRAAGRGHDPVARRARGALCPDGDGRPVAPDGELLAADRTLADGAASRCGAATTRRARGSRP